LRAISSEIRSYIEGSKRIAKKKTIDIRRGTGFLVQSYQELIERVARLSFHNPEYVLLFRGQRKDHRNSSNATSLYPSIFRSLDRHILPQETIIERFNKLEIAENILVEQYDKLGAKRLRIHQILRWAIIQHYEITGTPLLDVTHSLRVACSFAQMEANDEEETFLYVLGLPQISGSITASSEHGVQMVRLLSICPPPALRPHYQEGLLLGEYPTISLKGKTEYERKEFCFGRRIIGKFRLGKKGTFWNSDFTSIPHGALYPNKRDPLQELSERIKTAIG